LIWTSIAHTIYVQAVGLDDGVLDGVFLILERLDLLCDVLGQRVQRRHPLFGGLAQLPGAVPADRDASRRLFIHQSTGRVRLVVRGARDVLQLRIVLRQLAGHRAELIEIVS